MYLYILPFIIAIISAANPGTTVCTDTSLNTQATCLAAGYCSWSGTACVAYTLNTDCYRVNEIGACRAGGVYAAFCVALSALNVQYDNVCGPLGQTTIDYNYVRFPISTTGLPNYSLTGITVADLTTKTPQSDYLYQVFSVNLQTADNTQLNAILDLYIAYATTLKLTSTHPYYIEKALFNTIQNIRDDKTMDDAKRSATLVKFWALANIYLDRLQTFSKYYQTNYYMLNFAQTTFSRLYLTVNGQDHTTTFSWVQYTSNGYIQVVSYPAKQFGVTNAISDVYYVRIITDSPTITLYALLTPLTVTYINSGSTVVISATNKLQLITSKTVSPHAAGAQVASASNDSASKKCVFTALTAASEYLFYITT